MKREMVNGSICHRQVGQRKSTDKTDDLSWRLECFMSKEIGGEPFTYLEGGGAEGGGEAG